MGVSAEIIGKPRHIVHGGRIKTGDHITLTEAEVEEFARRWREAREYGVAKGIATVEQPTPVPNEHPPIVPMVIADMEARMKLGVERYGVALQPHNGRDMLLDAYQEALDLTIYLKGCLVERDGLE